MSQLPFRLASKALPRLLLFDIDGTFTKSNHVRVGKHYGSSLLEALSITFGQTIQRNGVDFSGGTDPSITKAVLDSHGITEENCPKYQENVMKAFEMLPDIARKGVAEGRYNWKILPNVNELLGELAKRDDVKIGLLTGNIQPVALIKLQTAGVNTEVFMEGNPAQLFGAFGSDHGVRSELVKVARQRYCDFLGLPEVKPNDMVVIGDTPKDVACAHDNGVPCVAVTTGIHTSEDLSQADFVLDEGFKDVAASVKAIVETRKR